MAINEVLDVTLRVAGALEQLGITYLVGGSLASSLHGIPRSTQDVDMVAGLRAEHITPLVSALETDFYIDADMIRDAITRRACFNVIHLPTMFKVDIFVLSADPVAQEEMRRRQRITLSDEPALYLEVASAEDIVVQKLRWFRLGHELSERQWNDVLGVLKVQGARLDRPYMTRTAALLSVEDLLQRALHEAGLSDNH